MRAWILSIVLGVLVIGLGAYIIMVRPGAAKPITVVSSEYVPGFKRVPGPFQEASINVVSGQESLGAPDVTIDIDVLRPAFLPNVIRVKQGQVVRLRLHGKDSGLADMPELQGALGLNEFSGHGFQILGPYDVWVTGIRKDVTREVIFKATEAGEFPIECTVFCHPLHYLMQ